MNKKHMEECMKPHAIYHSLFGLGLGLLLAAILGISGMTGIVLGLVAMAIGFGLDYRMGMTKK